MAQAENKDTSQTGREPADTKDSFNPFSAFFPMNFLQLHAESASAFARAIAFLADDAAGFITGATLSINGGKYMI